MPRVSITMTAYNAEKYITDALQSVLMQSFDDFEFIIVDDGSSDATWQILNDCSDNRLIILRNEHDYIASLNCAMHMARGEYIVRMDADDMMHPDRLSMQVSLMEQNPELDVCTTWMEGFDLRGMHYVAPSAKGKLEHPLLHLLHKNNLYHPTAIIRSSFWKKHHLHYDSDYIYAEDYKLWSECAKLGATFFVIPQCLHYYRVSAQQVSRTKATAQAEVSHHIQQEIVEHITKQSAQGQPIRELHETLLALEKERLITHKELIMLCRNLCSRII
ncbi:MAG: glycosyltransferase family 2 protein [Alloprevotella sp.]|nr:MAG: glycosyltransferase family 2 protein [Alloprevotella sp.]